MSKIKHSTKDVSKEIKDYIPYRVLINKPKYRIVNSSGKSYGTFREKTNAYKEIKRLKETHYSDDFMLEHLR